jgi:hypothetical protein
VIRAAQASTPGTWLLYDAQDHGAVVLPGSRRWLSRVNASCGINEPSALRVSIFADTMEWKATVNERHQVLSPCVRPADMSSRCWPAPIDQRGASRGYTPKNLIVRLSSCTPSSSLVFSNSRGSQRDGTGVDQPLPHVAWADSGNCLHWWNGRLRKRPVVARRIAGGKF